MLSADVGLATADPPAASPPMRAAAVKAAVPRICLLAFISDSLRPIAGRDVPEISII
jgi:hypothetical protein